MTSFLVFLIDQQYREGAKNLSVRLVEVTVVFVALRRIVKAVFCGVRACYFRKRVFSFAAVFIYLFFLFLLKRLDLLQMIMSRHLIGSETLAAEERAQRRTLEKSLRTIAKRNYRMKLVRHSGTLYWPNGCDIMNFVETTKASMVFS